MIHISILCILNLWNNTLHRQHCASIQISLFSASTRIKFHHQIHLITTQPRNHQHIDQPPQLLTQHTNLPTNTPKFPHTTPAPINASGSDKNARTAPEINRIRHYFQVRAQNNYNYLEECMGGLRNLNWFEHKTHCKH